MTKTERLAIAKVFRAAKLELWDGKDFRHNTRFICFAIDDAKQERNDAQCAINLVRSRLSPCYTLEDWMQKYYPHLYSYDTVMMQRTRHAWLDSLIAEFEA